MSPVDHLLGSNLLALHCLQCNILHCIDSLKMSAGRQKRKAGPEASGGSPGGRGEADGACVKTTTFL
jgi:hypothetical protein